MCLVQAQKDTLRTSPTWYRNVEHYSQRNKALTYLYQWLFVSPRSTAASSTPSIQPHWKLFQGKVIRHIHIQVHDPFSGPGRWEELGNRFHRTTRQGVVQRLLLCQSSQRLDSLQIEESARLLRKQRIFRQVQLTPVASTHPDSVDINVDVTDSWSIYPSGTFSGTQANGEVTERNFLGLNHELECSVSTLFSNQSFGKSARYSIANVGQTFSSFSLLGLQDVQRNVLIQAQWDKAFLSPLTRWAYGVTLSQQEFWRNVFTATDQLYLYKLNRNTQDVWLGYSHRMLPKQPFVRGIWAARFYQMRYRDAPDAGLDPSGYFAHERTTLLSLGASQRQFRAERNLFNFEIREDIPLGWSAVVTSGVQYKGSQTRAYWGGRLHWARYQTWGYHNTQLQWGSFVDGGAWEQMAYRLDYLYFTPLLPLGHWQLRQFFKANVCWGDRRDAALQDRVSLNGIPGLPDYSAPQLLGFNTVQLSWQTQTYVTGHWAGFHMSPFINITAAVLDDRTQPFVRQPWISKLGVGILLYNDYLVFNSVQLAFSYYPYLPNAGADIWRINTYKSFDFTPQDVAVVKPQIVPYP